MDLVGKIKRRAVRFRDRRRLEQITAVEAAALPANGAPGTRFNVAVVGAGAMGRDQCLGLQQVPQAKIVAVADHNPEALAWLQRQVGLPGVTFYEDTRALLEAVNIDLLCVATNTTAHLAIAQQGVEAGVRRIIIEKPIGNQVAASRHLAQACSRQGVKLTVNHSRRWSGDYAAIKRCVVHGYIGALRRVWATLGPNGMAMGGLHFVDLISYLADAKIEWVVGFLDAVDKPNRRGAQFEDPSGYALLGLERGIRGYVDTSADLGIKHKTLVLLGQNGRIEVDERQRLWHLVHPVLGRRRFAFQDIDKPAGYFTKVAAEALSDTAPSCGAEEGIAALEAVVAVHLSHQAGHARVGLPLQGEEAEMAFPFP